MCRTIRATIFYVIPKRAKLCVLLAAIPVNVTATWIFLIFVRRKTIYAKDTQKTMIHHLFDVAAEAGKTLTTNGFTQEGKHLLRCIDAENARRGG